MLSVLLAVTALSSPVGVDRVSLSPCAPNKHTACYQPARRDADRSIAIGKRCHPDPTRSLGCREYLTEDERQRHQKVARAD